VSHGPGFPTLLGQVRGDTKQNAVASRASTTSEMPRTGGQTPPGLAHEEPRKCLEFMSSWVTLGQQWCVRSVESPSPWLGSSELCPAVPRT
jgi:hypothetical protein